MYLKVNWPFDTVYVCGVFVNYWKKKKELAALSLLSDHNFTIMGELFQVNR